MTPCEEKGYKVGDKFIVNVGRSGFEYGQLIELYKDDGSDAPLFSGNNSYFGSLCDGLGGAYLGLEDVSKIVSVGEDIEPLDSDKIILMEPFGPIESDPTGRNQHESGAKLDAGKVRPNLVIGGFAKALRAVSEVGTYGANKYTDNGWQNVPDGVNRYSEAMMRHYLSEMSGEKNDPDTDIQHAAHMAWNALARLELMLREEDKG